MRIHIFMNPFKTVFVDQAGKIVYPGALPAERVYPPQYLFRVSQLYVCTPYSFAAIGLCRSLSSLAISCVICGTMDRSDYLPGFLRLSLSEIALCTAFRQTRPVLFCSHVLLYCLASVPSTPGTSDALTITGTGFCLLRS